MKTMKGMYLEKNGEMAYYIGSYKEDDEEFVEIADIQTNIAKSAFAHSDIENILFKGCTTNICKKAFEGCESLTTVIFGELGKDKAFEKDGEKRLVRGIRHLKLNSIKSNFTIQAEAFKDCSSLTTLVLPEIKGTLTIEKDAFCGCEALRTVVALCGEIDFTENPFADCPEHLTFICKKDSAVARFARENGYRSVYVEQSV